MPPLLAGGDGFKRAVSEDGSLAEICETSGKHVDLLVGEEVDGNPFDGAVFDGPDWQQRARREKKLRPESRSNTTRAEAMKDEAPNADGGGLYISNVSSFFLDSRFARHKG